jgi:hypothetical protein
MMECRVRPAGNYRKFVTWPNRGVKVLGLRIVGQFEIKNLFGQDNSLGG